MFEHISQIRSLHIEYEVATEQLLSHLSIDRKKPLVYLGEEKPYEPPQEDEKPRSGFRDLTIPCELRRPQVRSRHHVQVQSPISTASQLSKPRIISLLFTIYDTRFKIHSTPSFQCPRLLLLGAIRHRRSRFMSFQARPIPSLAVQHQENSRVTPQKILAIRRPNTYPSLRKIILWWLSGTLPLRIR